MRRQATEPHLEDAGIYRKRWWARLDCSQNHLRDETEAVLGTLRSSALEPHSGLQKKEVGLWPQMNG